MTERDLIERLDARLEHVDAHMARAEVVFEELREEMRLNREERAASRAEHEDLRLFIHEQTGLMQAFGRRMERALKASSARADRKLDAVLKRLDDMGDQIGANTEATWRMLDRFSGNGGTAPRSRKWQPTLCNRMLQAVT